MSEIVLVKEKDLSPVSRDEKEKFLAEFDPHRDTFETEHLKNFSVTKRDIFIMCCLLGDYRRAESKE